MASARATAPCRVVTMMKDERDSMTQGARGDIDVQRRFLRGSNESASRNHQLIDCESCAPDGVSMTG